MQKIEVSIIIVHFNTPLLLNSCLESIYKVKKNTDFWEIIIVDNNSTQNSIKQIAPLPPYAKLILEKENHGFSGGNNIGIKNAKGKYILLLNSDTKIVGDAIQKTLTVFEDKYVGAATCKLELPDGTIDPASHRGFPTPWAAFTYFSGLEKLFPKISIFSEYHQLYKDLSVTHEIDLPSGAFMLLKKEVLNNVGLLDEDFFMYGEDIDLAYRIKQEGYKIVFVPSGTVIHLKKQSGRESSDSDIKLKTNKYFYETMKLFYRKHYKNKYPRFVMNFIFLLLDIKMKFL